MDPEYTDTQDDMKPEYEDMCKILIETYNTSIIDYFDKELRNSIFEEAKKCANDNHMREKERKVLAKLIENKENQKKYPLPKVDYLGGPNSITYHFSNKYKKAVYILGETHDMLVDCPNPNPQNPEEKYPNIENFLFKYFNNQIAFTDFYLEMPAYVVSSGYRKFGYSFLRLDRVREYFKKCIGLERNQDYCNSSRMHFFDIRQGEVKGGINSASLFQSDMLRLKNNLEVNYTLLDKKQILEVLEIIRLFVDRWNSFFTFFEKFNDENEDNTLKYKKFWYDQIYNFPILKKEIDRMDKNVRPLLNKFIQSELNILLTNNGYEVASMASSQILFDLKNLDPSKLDIINISKSLSNLLNEIVKINVLISDAYLLARIFKKFNINNPDVKHRSIDEPEEPHNIIIYAGNMHAENYRKFLKYLGFRQLEQSPEVKIFKNCVNMSNITQPLFSKYPYREEDDNPHLVLQDKIKSNNQYGREDKPHFVLRSEFDSFESVFKVDTETIFEQPVVPKDLLPKAILLPVMSQEDVPEEYLPYGKRKNTYTMMKRSRQQGKKSM